MKKDEKFIIFSIILLVIGCLFFSGCSAVKAVTAAVTPTVSTVPQETEKINNITKCRGEIKVMPDGSYYCTDGFYMKESGKSAKERKLTIKERILQSLNKYFGLYILIMGILFFTTPSLFYMALAKQKKALIQVIKGVQKSRRENKDLNTALDAEQDEEVKKLIKKLKMENNI